MRQKTLTILFYFFIFLIASASVQADQEIVVSKNVGKYNRLPRITVDPNTGNVYIVWTQMDTNNFESSRTYGTLLKRLPSGKYKLLKPKMISKNKGYHANIRAAWNLENNEFFAVWDTLPFGGWVPSQILGRVIEYKKGKPQGKIYTIVKDKNSNYSPLLARTSFNDEEELLLIYSKTRHPLQMIPGIKGIQR